MLTSSPKIVYLCGQCGSANVSRDAWAEWDVAGQQWVLRAVFDDSFCHDCSERVSLEQRPAPNPRLSR